jgi:hypothetical protein
MQPSSDEASLDEDMLPLDVNSESGSAYDMEGDFLGDDDELVDVPEYGFADDTHFLTGGLATGSVASGGSHSSHQEAYLLDPGMDSRTYMSPEASNGNISSCVSEVFDSDDEDNNDLFANYNVDYDEDENTCPSTWRT